MRISTTTALVAGLAATALATPVHHKRQSQDIVVSVAAFSAAPSASRDVIPTATTTESATESDVDWCANYDASVESSTEVWNDRGVGKFLDEYLSANGEAGWLSKMANEALPDTGDSGAAGCGFRDQSCFGGLSCSGLAGSGHGAEYWIFNAASKLQDDMERAHENLQDSVIENSLSVSTIASDFKITFQSDAQILRFLAAAFGIAGGLLNIAPSGPLLNPAKALTGVLGNLFTESANGISPANIDPSKAMDSALLSIFSSERNLLDNILKTAVGGEGDTATLPGQSGEYSNNVAKFFSEGVFLQQGDQVTQFFSSGFEVLQKKLVDIALQQYGYLILKDENFLDADSCGQQKGARWMNVKGHDYCIRLTYRDGDNNRYWPVSDEIIDKLDGTYKYDITQYYNAACDCAVNGNGEVDLNIPVDGTPPRCFYNIKCQYAEICLESNDIDWSICWPKDWNEITWL